MNNELVYIILTAVQQFFQEEDESMASIVKNTIFIKKNKDSTNIRFETFFVSAKLSINFKSSINN